MRDVISRFLQLVIARQKAVMSSGLLALAVLWIYRANRRRNRLRERFGGPSGLNSPQFLPFLGYVPRSLDQFFTALEIYAETYGDIYSIRFMGMQLLVVSSSELVQQVLKERPYAYVRSTNKNNVIPISGLFTAEGEIWKRHRRLCAPAFNEKSSIEMVPKMSHAASKMVRLLRSLPSTRFDLLNDFGEGLQLSPFRRLQLEDRASNLPIGPDLIRSLATFLDGLQGCGYVAQLSAFPMLTRDKFPWNLNATLKNFYRSLKKLNMMWDTVIQERRVQRAAGAEVKLDLLDKLQHLTDEELKGNLMIFVAAGFETTAMTIAWCLYYLCLYPDIQAKARSEVDEIGHDPQDGEDLNELLFVEACVIETLRVQPPGFFLLHEGISKTTLAGEQIPPGTMVATLLHKAMICKEEGGTAFQPDQWILPNGQGINRARLRSHLAFGGGPRECPGKHLAIKECVIVVATILRHFDNIRANSDIGKVHGRTRFVRAVEGLELKMKPRGI